MNPLLQKVLANKHTSGAALVYGAAVLIPKLGAIWFPNHTEQFKQTADIIEGASVMYGFAMGSDAKTQTQDEPKNVLAPLASSPTGAEKSTSSAASNL